MVRTEYIDVIIGRDPMAITSAYQLMLRAIRNYGRAGLCASAIAAVDVALWDLKARLLMSRTLRRFLAGAAGRRSNHA